MRMMIFLAMCALTPANALAQPIDPAVRTRIDRVLRATPLIDGHNDLPWALRENAKSSVERLASGTASRTPPLHTDIARLRQGRVGAQFWSVYLPVTITGAEAVKATLEQIDIVKRLAAAYPQDLALASTAADVRRVHAGGRIASLIGIEGGHQIGGSLAVLREFRLAGAGYMTLTHSSNNEWADSATDDPKLGGLSPFGIEVVREMNRIGMLVDLSHVSEETMTDALDATRSPVIFSHSSARGVTDFARNVPDTILRRLPANGGVVMVTFVPQFVSQTFLGWAAERSAATARAKALHPGDATARTRTLDEWARANPRPSVTVADVADHIEHIARVAGHDHVGIGGDFDGITDLVEGLDSVDDYPALFAELIRRGWSDANLAKLAGGNVLRVMARAEAVAASLSAESPPLASPAPGSR